MFGILGTSSSNSNDNQDKFTSVFIMVVMFLFVLTNVSRRYYDDPIMFKIQKQKYTLTQCKKYAALVPGDEDLTLDQKFQKHYYQVLNIAKARSSFSYLASTLGLSIATKDMRNSIIKDPFFAESGHFSRAKFLAHIKKIGISEHDYYELRREDLLHRQLQFLLSSGYSIPPHIALRFVSGYKAKRHFKVASVKHSEVKIQYSQKELVDFYNENQEKFQTPKKYKYTAVSLSLKEIPQQEYNLLQKMIDNGNLDGILKSYPKAVRQRLNQEEANYKFNSFVDQRDRIFKLGECSSFFQKDVFWIIKIEEVIESEQLPFEAVKESVVKLFDKKNKPLSIKLQNLHWKPLSFSAENFYSFDLPMEVKKAVFSLPVGKMQEFHFEGISYFLIVDSIDFSGISISEYDFSAFRSKINQEILQAIIASLVLSIES